MQKSTLEHQKSSNLINYSQLSKDKFDDRQGYPSYYAQDTYTVMTKKPWKTYYEHYNANQLHDPCCLDWNQGFNKFNQINEGWN